MRFEVGSAKTDGSAIAFFGGWSVLDIRHHADENSEAVDGVTSPDFEDISPRSSPICIKEAGYLENSSKDQYSFSQDKMTSLSTRRP